MVDIRAIRKKRNMMQSHFSRVSGVSQQLISMIENGSRKELNNMKEFKMTIFLGSTMMTHQCDSMYGIIIGLQDMANKVPEYGAYLTREVIDEFIEDLVALKRGDKGLQINQSAPFIRIERVEPYCPPTLPDCTTGKEVVHG